MSKTIEISRDLADRIEQALLIGLHDSSPIVEEWRALLAAPVVERQDVIDLDAVDWETIQQAADESNWMPNEYMRNDWIADVCNFLKYGRADTSPPAPEVAELLRDAYQEGYCDGQNNPNGYSSKVERDKCVARLLEPNP